jgi:hypothetical protein
MWNVVKALSIPATQEIQLFWEVPECSAGTALASLVVFCRHCASHFVADIQGVWLYTSNQVDKDREYTGDFSP